ncbi:hypothetical protein IVB30_28070 [Bradyrhizobium sp. 200]|uniref:hypothetical protein n=1 Tax=Bradyrhizobium sp. 200 TaxID=2782665 RepID=UPI001FFF4590|nr:hypothetical protein [Bradyrhizobium sp. 200]UPJ47137.1 hypothetical protein IVB30_28070 [Bradyrhizobium sp. 200]
MPVDPPEPSANAVKFALRDRPRLTRNGVKSKAPIADERDARWPASKTMGSLKPDVSSPLPGTVTTGVTIVISA